MQGSVDAGSPAVDLVVPVKSLALAKSRLLGAADAGRGRRRTHAALVLAMVEDTLVAARTAPALRRILVVTPDRAVAHVARRCGVEVAAGVPPPGLNPALEHGARLLRRDDPTAVVGALQADLPALRPDELADAIASSGGRRAFCADRTGSGTTLLLAAPGEDLHPRFGHGSGRAHTRSGAVRLAGPWPTLGCDVDDAADLDAAARLGLGARTAAFLAARSLAPTP